MKLLSLLTLGITILFSVTTRADVQLHALFSDDMVLQREKPVPVWGTAQAGEKVTVSIGNQSRSTQADASGIWRVDLAPMPAAHQLTLSVQGNNRVELKNVAVGDVFLCSGQSNMQWPLSDASNAREEIAAANYPDIRLFTVPHKVAGVPQRSFAAPTRWEVCTPPVASHFSAVGFFFGRELFERLKIPIGLIDSTWGGTVAQAWTSRDTLLQRDDLRESTLQTEQNFMADAAKASSNPNRPAVLFNGMIAPLLPFQLRGVIWYQGESNADNPAQYRTLFPDLIRDWRSHWKAKQDGSEFGFFFVQLANFTPRVAQPVQPGWAALREAQTMTLQLPRTGMATAIDLGEANDIHPRNKQDVGKRLALAALAIEYGQNVEYSGPMFHLMEMETGSNQVRIHFTHALGIKTTDSQAPRGFAIQDQSDNWHHANARIDGESVVLWNDGVLQPKAIRYAWANNPDVNLVNAAGLPAVPFRTDKP